MSRCGYYSCYKGKPACKHPTNGEYKTKMFGRSGASHPCEMCRKSCGGIYPSELPSVKFDEVEVIDANGSVIS